MPRLIPALLIASVLGVGGFVLSERMGWFEGSASAEVQGAPVRRGPLRISVLEKGNLESARSVELKSEIEGQVTILYLIEEGTVVEPGDLLVELDATSLIEKGVSQEIAVESARSTQVKASQNLEIQRSQNESDLAEAERAAEFARKDLEKYVEGDWPQQLQAAKDAILLSEEELKRAEEALKFSNELHDNGFVTRTELEADDLAHQRASINRDQELRSLELLEQFDFPRQREQYRADVEEAERELKRVELQAMARLVDFEADLRSATARLELETEKLEKLQDQIAKAKVMAPVEGMVVYAEAGNSRFGNNDPIEEGTSVRERQALITIPSTDGIKIEASIHESVLEKVNVGQSVIVRVDALPDRMFTGTVRYKAPLPDKNSYWANPDLRVYRTDIEVDDPDPAMRPGMTCSLEVVVADLEDAVHIPVQSVFLDGGKPVAFVSEGGGYNLRSLELGLSNEAWIEVKSGLKEGEVVALSQPPGFRLAPAMESKGDGGPNPDGRAPEGRTPDGQAPEGRSPENRGPKGGNAGSSDRPGRAVSAGGKPGAAPSGTASSNAANSNAVKTPKVAASAPSSEGSSEQMETGTASGKVTSAIQR